MLLKRDRPTTTRITPSVGDGGVDILDKGAAPDGGDVVYQVKRYTGPLASGQRARVEKSLERLSADPRWQHLNVTQWFLVLPWDPTTEALAWLDSLGAAHGLNANWHGLTFIDALAASYPRIIDAYLGGGLGASVDGDAVMALVDEISQLSSRGIDTILARLGDESAPSLEFPAPQTEVFLDRVSAAQVSGSVLLDGLDGQLANVQHRAARADIPGVMDARSEYADLVAWMPDSLTTSSCSVGDAAVAVGLVQEWLRKALDVNFDALEVQMARIDVAAGISSRILERQRFEGLTAYRESLLSLGRYVDVVRCEVDAATRRTLLVTGRWGTGKSYQIARYAQREIAQERPVLLLRARDFVDSTASIIGQRSWRSQLGCQGLSDDDFLEVLDGIGIWAKAPLTIAVDGLNESSLRDTSAALERLAALVERFPFIRLIVSDRQDEARSATLSIPTFRHQAPARTAMSRALENALGVPPGTRWHAALTNPLLASMAARIVSAHGATGAPLSASLGRVSLLDAWIDLLVRETSAELDFTPSTVRRVIDSAGCLSGTTTVRQVAERSSLALETVDRIIQRFVAEGLLEWCAEGGDLVRLRWQGASDVLGARIALEDDRKGGSAALIRAADEASRLNTLDTIAETLPNLSRPSEIPDLRIPSTTAEERDFAFALSLDGRSESQITARTLKHARRLLLSGGEPAKHVLLSVLATPRREKLGVKWLNAQLSSVALVQRSKFWPQVLVDLADGSPAEQDAIRDLLTWYADTLLDKLVSDVEMADMIELFAWFGCAPQHSGFPGLGVAYIVELAHRAPSIFDRVWGRVALVDDDHPRDALLLAASGVISRWPGTDAAIAAKGVCAEALNTRTAKSFRSVASIHLALVDERPLHEFLRDASALRIRRRMGRIPLGMSFEDRAMFADGRSPRDAQRHESQVWASFGIPRRHDRRVLADHQAMTALPQDSHGGALLRGRWLVHQYAHHPAGARLWFASTGPAKAGTDLNSDVAYLTKSSDAWDFWVDPTLPLELTIRTSDRATERTWWAIDDGDSSVRVIDPDGVDWLVLEGGFRYLSPAPESDARGRTVGVGSHSWLSGQDDGTPRPGLLRHAYVAVSDALLATSQHSAVAPLENGQLRFSELFRSNAGVLGALVHVTHDGSEAAAPTKTLLDLLGASWTGESIDCRDASGALVVTDPANGTHGPRATLVRRDKLESALRRSGLVVTVGIRVSEFGSRILVNRPQVSVVQIDGSSQIEA